MQTKNVTQPSYPFSISHLIERQLLAFGYVFVAGTDIITTYFGLTKYGLHETIPWTQWIIDNYGWEGTILRFILSSVFFVMLFRYLHKNVFVYFRYPAWVILVVYFTFTTVNNSILIMGKM